MHRIELDFPTFDSPQLANTILPGLFVIEGKYIVNF